LKTETTAKEIDIHRIITTSFNVKLNLFIARYEQKKPSFEIIKTGGVMEIRVHNQEEVFAAQAYFLQDFRENLYRKSVYWKFPLDSFLSELDLLIIFYLNSLKQMKCKMDEEKRSALNSLLLVPLSDFFKSIDQDFWTNYFQKRIADLNGVIEKEPRNEPKSNTLLCLSIIVVSYSGVPLKGIELQITPYRHRHDCIVDEKDEKPSVLPIKFIRTDNNGLAEINLPTGLYSIKLIEKHCDEKIVHIDKRNIRVEMKVLSLTERIKRFIGLSRKEKLMDFLNLKIQT
jgi:hypothetical protein